MKVRDLQFANYFLLNEIDLDENLVAKLLDYNIEVRDIGEPDAIVDKMGTIVCSSPSSLTRFLFNVLYTLLSRYIRSDIHRDKLGLGLLHMCRDYVYSDQKPHEFSGPPVLINFNKIPIPSFIIRELIEPLVGKIRDHSIFYVSSKFTDVCRIETSHAKLSKHYGVPENSVASSDFPIVTCNTNVFNSAAINAHMTVKCLELSLGRDKSQRVLKNVLLNEDCGLIDNVLLVLNGLYGDPEFVIDFFKYLKSNVEMNEDEKSVSAELQYKSIQSHASLKNSIKLAADNVTPQVFRQWSQWSMLMGLIEKQLSPMRGSMWPATKNLKPFEDKHRHMVALKTQEKGSQLNFEELLETSRDLYNKNSVEPGKLIEVMLRDNRVWKT